MRFFVSILLLVIMGGFGLGIVQRLHMMEHEQEDAQARAADQAAGMPESVPQPERHHHSEDNCPICAQFHAPIISMAYLVWLVDSGDWVRYVSMLAVSQQAQSIPDRMACRGPPIFSCC